MAATTTLFGQATPAAQRTGDLSAFVLYSRLTPDYGPTNNNGFTFGVDYTQNVRWWVKPSIEFRGKVANGTTVDEKAFGGGIRVEKPIREVLHPYADFLVSAGSINYHLLTPPILPNGKPYTSDGTVTYSYGAGLDYDVWKNFAVRGDFQYERWRLDKYTPIYLTPTVWSVGVVYRVKLKRPFSR